MDVGVGEGELASLSMAAQVHCVGGRMQWGRRVLVGDLGGQRVWGFRAPGRGWEWLWDE